MWIRERVTLDIRGNFIHAIDCVEVILYMFVSVFFFFNPFISGFLVENKNVIGMVCVKHWDWNAQYALCMISSGKST